MVKQWNRWARHLFQSPGALRRRFTRDVLRDIEEHVKRSETQHGGEIRFAVESRLSLSALQRGDSPRTRAVDLFSRLRVWDTEENNGVLIYVLLADRGVEIVADRGLNKRIAPSEWEAVCRSMETHFREGRWREGSLAGIEGATLLLVRHFTSRGPNPNELPDKPSLL